jgi:hypothetical protein
MLSLLDLIITTASFCLFITKPRRYFITGSVPPAALAISVVPEVAAAIELLIPAIIRRPIGPFVVATLRRRITAITAFRGWHVITVTIIPAIAPGPIVRATTIARISVVITSAIA